MTTGSELSYQLGELPDRASYLAAAASCLQAIIPGDALAWNNIDAVTHAVELWFQPPEANISEEATAAVLDDHPLVRSYLTAPVASPRRVSDCVSEREWLSSRTYSELFVPMGARHQLAIPAVLFPPSAGHLWVINRSTSDFRAADVAVASALQPVLEVLDRIYARAPAPKIQDDLREEARRRAGLTPRELDVLTLIAEGLSAQQIARARRISVRTVRKHLEHVYEKLECHDRLMAVNKARRLFLL
jgi:DNA-binding CsgD family transcriptional regulator